MLFSTIDWPTTSALVANLAYLYTLPLCTFFSSLYHNVVIQSTSLQYCDIKSLIRSILDKNKKEILYNNIKFKVLLVIYKEVIQLKNIRGYYSKVIINTNFPTIKAVYIVISNKTFYLFTS